MLLFGMRAAGFVLVGGRSSRMGRDKALLRLNSQTILQEVAIQVAAVTGNVALVGDPERYREFGFDCLPDLRRGCGPLAGIEAALESQRGEFNLILACDMPELEQSWLSRLLAEARNSDAPCLAGQDSRGLHPLCAVYRSECLPFVRSALDSGRLKLLDLMRDLGTISLATGHPIWNLNTPREWAAWQDRGKTLNAADGN